MRSHGEKLLGPRQIAPLYFFRQQNLGDSRLRMAVTRAAAAHPNQAEDAQYGGAEVPVGTPILHDRYHEFEQDFSREAMVMTSCPGGFLRRKAKVP